MKIIAYILFVLQVLSMAGHVMSGGMSNLVWIMFRGGIPGFIGFMLPAIVGIILLVIHNKRQHKKDAGTSDSFDGDEK